MKNYILEILELINSNVLSTEKKIRLKDLLCFLSDWKIKNPDYREKYPQLDFILYNASRKLRTFGYNRLNKLKNEYINNSDMLTIIKDNLIDELYRTKSGYVLDKLQKEVLDEFEEYNQKLFLSAPTSFGKTFLLQEIIYRHSNNYKNIVIVLPTVALLMEVTQELETFNNKHCLQYKLHNSIYKDLKIEERNIFILTPERVLRLLAILPDIKIDFFFYDEIYKIDDDVTIKTEEDDLLNSKANQNVQDQRAVAFRLALYFLLKLSPACYLAGPFIELDQLQDGFKKMLNIYNIHSKEITFIPTMKNTITFEKDKCCFSSPIKGNVCEDALKVKSPMKKLIYIAKKIGFSLQNQAIVYCLFPAYTEHNACEFANNYKINFTLSNRLKIFIEHLKLNYSFSFDKNLNSLDHWNFLYSLQNGVGIHNGKLPRYIQKEVMDLFNNGEFSTLFCTSTIVEGVNTNAKNVVVYHNPAGKSDEGKKFLLLNINGRAGRYNHHFIGNIVYIRNESVEIEQKSGISLNFKIYSEHGSLSNLDLENVNVKDVSYDNAVKYALIKLDKDLLPDSVFEQNRLIERRLQEKVLREICENINDFYGIEEATIDVFIEKYFDIILQIWADINELSLKTAKWMKTFSVEYAKKGFSGIFTYAFSKGLNENEDNSTFVNRVYREGFSDVKNLIEYQLPKIICLFETLIGRAFEIKNIIPKQELNFSKITRFFEIGAKTQLGTDMIEKAVPNITVRKIEKKFNNEMELDEQRQLFKNNFNEFTQGFDEYELLQLNKYIKNYCD